MVLEASRQARQQVQPPIHFPRQRRPGIRGHGAAIKAGDYVA
jgi:hypothetical protein